MRLSSFRTVLVPGKGEATKERILTAAHALVMGYGLAGTSIDMVLTRAAVTKGSFFYHFKSKQDLAYALVQRYADQDAAHLEGHLQHVEAVSDDPLVCVFGFIDALLAEVDQIAVPDGGCLYASYIYEWQDLLPEIHQRLQQSFALWRQRWGTTLNLAIATYPPLVPVTGESLADLILVAFEGGFITMRVLNDPTQLSQHLRHYRQYLELLFGPTVVAEVLRKQAKALERH